MNLTDVDRLLDTASQLDRSTPTRRIRVVREQLTRAAVFLSYARHVLSVDIGVLRHASAQPGDLQALVDDLAGVLASASVGGGWSLSSDALSTMVSANRTLLGEADGLLSAHGGLATADLNSPEAIVRVVGEIEDQLANVTVRSERVEQRIREVQALIVQQYASGLARVDDWLE